MSNGIEISEVLALPVEERIRLVEDIWDSIAAVPEAVVLTDAQRKDLEARLDAHRRNPGQDSPWSEVTAHLARRL
jgi:putative addiction module component (TIGR02574 family)